MLSTIYLKAVSSLQCVNWIPALLTRVALAGVFIESGWGKIQNTPKVAEYFESLGLPHPLFQAHFVAWNELIVGICMILGFLTRLSTIPLIIMMAVAIKFARVGDIHEWTDLFSLIEFLYAALGIWLLFSGPGKISIDHFISQRLSKNNSPH